MKIWRRLGQAGLAAGVLAVSAAAAQAACIDTMTNTVDDPADCLFADGGETDNCRLAISVDMNGAGMPPSNPKKIECVDGAPCDADGSVNGTCTFRVGACVNLPVMGCSADTITAAVVSKPSAKEANDAIKRASSVYNRRALQTAMSGSLLTGAEACTAADIPVKVDLRRKGGTCGSPVGLKCASDLDCEDYCMPKVSKSKINVDVGVTAASSGRSKFKLNCLPATGTFANGAQALEADPVDLIGGPLAMGREDDFVIRNGNVRAVVRKPGRQHSFSLLHGGQIIDADIVRANPADDRDGWLGIQPMINISSTQGTESVIVMNDGTNGQAAILESSGPDDLFDTIKGDILVAAAGLSVPASAVDHNLPVSVKTRHILTPYSNAVQIATTVQNQSGSPLAYYIGDFINPGGQLEPFGPGQGYGEAQLRNGATANTGGQSLDYLAFQGGLDSAGVTYGLIFPPTNVGSRVQYRTGAFASSGVFAWIWNNDLFGTLVAAPATKPAGGFAVPSNGENTLRRWFVIGETIADVTKFHTELYKPKLAAALQGVVTVGGAPAARAHVTLVNDTINFPNACTMSQNCVNVYSSTLTDEYGFYRFVVPEGTYRVAARKAGAPYEGSLDAPTETTVVLKKKKTTVQDVALPQTGSVVVNVEDQNGDPVAAKVSVVGFPKSPDPLNVEYAIPAQNFVGRYFGFNFEEKTDIFGIADARYSDTTGTTGSFDLEPGQYHVVVSRGYEYDLYDEVINVTAGGTTTVDAVVNRVIDTSGFVSIDTHVHMINSPDSTVSRERRILSMIAEGVDFFVNTDHDLTHELADEISAMGVGALVANAPSVETTTSHYGHFNTWPLTVDNSRIDGGAPDWSYYTGDYEPVTTPGGPAYPVDGAYDRLPADIYSLFNPASQVIQINHFNSGTLGHFNMLGIDTAQVPPVSSNQVYRCVGGSYAGAPCQVQICLGGTNDGNACATNANCPGGGVCNSPSGPTACLGTMNGTCTLTGDNLGSYLRMNPAASNLYDDGFTALEVWIEAGRGQTALLLGDNMADWFNLLNQGSFKAGVADSDTHSNFIVQAGGPRTFVASSTDAPALIDANELAQNVNGLRAIGSNGPFMRVELENGTAQTASHALGSSRTVPFTAGPDANSINLHIEAPTWAEYDRIDVYMNSTSTCQSQFTFFGVVNPSSCSTVAPQLTLDKGVDFSVNVVDGISGPGNGQRQVTDVSIPVTISADTWVVVVVRGTDGVSRPLFPTQPQDLATGPNSDLDDLTDGGSSPPWNLGEQGALALAFSNPLFFDDGDNVCHGGTACPGL